MKFISTLVSLACAGAALAAPAALEERDSTSAFSPTPIKGCLTSDQATSIVNAYIYLLGNPTASNFNATATDLLASGFTEYSDSINQLVANSTAALEGKTTFKRPTAFIAGSGSQPPLSVSTLDQFNSCNKISWRWISTKGAGDDSEPVKGITDFTINDSGRIHFVYAELNSAAFLLNLGYTMTASS